MELEHFNTGRAEAATKADLNSKLFESGYFGPGLLAGKGVDIKGVKDKQASEAEHFVGQKPDAKETREQELDQKIKDRFGTEVFDHLKDWDWLIENRKKLEAGFSKTPAGEKGELARRMSDLSIVGEKPLIHLKPVESSSRGTIVPKRTDINLRRIGWSDDYLGHFYK